MLEWVREKNGMGLWAKRSDGSRHHEVFVKLSVDGATFHALGNPDPFPSLESAKAYCQSQEDAAAPEPEIQLPKPGDVWGHPDKRETRRFVVVVFDYGVFYSSCGYDRELSNNEWQAWVRETSAVELIGDREAMAAKCVRMQKEFDAAVEHHQRWVSKIDDVLPERERVSGDLLHNICCAIVALKNSRDALATEVGEMTRDRAELKKADTKIDELAAKLKEREDDISHAVAHAKNTPLNTLGLSTRHRKQFGRWAKDEQASLKRATIGPRG